MNVIIADDEAPARQRMRSLLARFDDVVVVGEAEDGESAVRLCERLAPDAVFLDIRMPGLSGLDAADFLKHGQTAVVFVSAYDEHAFEAFEVKALDYLSKPVRPSRLAESLERIRERGRPPQAAAAPARKLGVPTGESTELVSFDQIRYARVAHGLLELYCERRKYNLTWTLKQLEDRLGDDPRFVKISRQALVNFNAIKTIDPLYSGTSALTMSDGAKLEASRSATKALKKRLG